MFSLGVQPEPPGSFPGLWNDHNCLSEKSFLCSRSCTAPTNEPTSNPTLFPTKSPTALPSRSPTTVQISISDEEEEVKNLIGFSLIGFSILFLLIAIFLMILINDKRKKYITYKLKLNEIDNRILMNYEEI